MKIGQLHYINDQWHRNDTNALNDANCQLVFAFGASEYITNPVAYDYIRNCFPKADIVFSSTAGEIIHENVYDNSIVITAIEFEKTTVRCFETNINRHANSYEAGRYLMQQLEAEDLEAVFIISDGSYVNGSELVAGLNKNNSNNVPVTGGLAGDAARFLNTYVGLNRVPEEGQLVSVGFYGNNLKTGHGYFGGWDEFGHERTITRADKNVLYEIDGKNALDLYKEYLGPFVDQLPGSALLFPLSIRMPGSEEMLVRTILALDEEKKTMTFAGNLPIGSKVRLMKANFDKLINGSSAAAKYCFNALESEEPTLALLVSCVGRKLVLNEKTEEEIEAVRAVFGERTAIAGFYSYGEISPFGTGEPCELHNQTMTITTFSES